MRMDSNTSQTLIFHSQLLNKCKKCTKRRFLTYLSNKWMFVACNMRMEPLMLLLIRELLILCSAEMDQDLMLIKCLVKFIEFFPQQESIFVFLMVFQNRDSVTSRNKNLTGLILLIKLLNQQFQHQL